MNYNRQDPCPHKTSSQGRINRHQSDNYTNKMVVAINSYKCQQARGCCEGNEQSEMENRQTLEPKTS